MLVHWAPRCISITQKRKPMPSNADLFDAGMNKAHDIIYNHIADILLDVCEAATTYAMYNHKGFKNLTGNTHTGYACGFYIDGVLKGYITSSEKAPRPVRVKLRKGESFTTPPDYDGDDRTWGPAKVDTDGGYGDVYAIRFLEAHKPKNRKGLAFCMTTGTEYSEYLETARGADVLTGTFQKIPDILTSNLKPIQ